MSVHLRKGVVPEGRDVIGEWDQGMIEVIGAIRGWVVLIIDMAIKMIVVKNRNE